MSLFVRFFSFAPPRNNRAKLGVFIAFSLLFMSLFAAETVLLESGSVYEGEFTHYGSFEGRVSLNIWYKSVTRNSI